MQTALKDISIASYKDYKFHYLLGASFAPNNTIISWHNAEMLHASPIALNFVHESIFKSFAKDEYSISITNEPIPIRPEEEMRDQDLLWHIDTTFEFLFPFITYIIMAILSAKYTSFYIEVNNSLIWFEIRFEKAFFFCFQTGKTM